MSSISKVEAAIVDLCSQVESAIGRLREDYQITMYEVCGGLNNHLTREMDRLIYYIRRLVEQNAVLSDRVRALEKRDDPEQVRRGDRHLHDPQEGEIQLHARRPETVDEIRSRGPRGRVRSYHRQAG